MPVPEVVTRALDWIKGGMQCDHFCAEVLPSKEVKECLHVFLAVYSPGPNKKLRHVRYNLFGDKTRESQMLFDSALSHTFSQVQIDAQQHLINSRYPADRSPESLYNEAAYIADINYVPLALLVTGGTGGGLFMDLYTQVPLRIDRALRIIQTAVRLRKANAEPCATYDGSIF